MKREIKYIDFEVATLRQKRQDENNKKARDYLEGQIKTNQRVINKDEEKRILNKLEDLVGVNKDLPGMLTEIKENNNSKQLVEIVVRLLSRNVSIKASRQGALDEAYQLNSLNQDFMQANNLPFSLFNPKTHKKRVHEMVPVREGGLVTRKEFREVSDRKNMAALKSFDGELWNHDKEKCIGYVFAKIVVGIGGHQDNVFSEARELISWYLKQENKLKEKLLVILIDYSKTSEKKFKELYDTAAEAGNKNIWVVNTKSFQEKIISMLGE